MEKMASELDLPNGEAVRESPVTETGYQGMSGVPAEAFPVTEKRNWVVTRVSRPERGRDFFIAPHRCCRKEVLYFAD